VGAASTLRDFAMKPILPILILAALAACLWPSAASATAPCPSQPGGPRCHFWYGKATFIDDGDTIDVNIAGDHRGSRRVRFTGINAMELRRYSKYRRRRRGACHAVAAANRVESLVRRSRRRVRLAAQHPRSRAGKRLRREISVRINGVWVDLGAILVAEGRALWLPSHREWAWNRTYAAYAKSARAAGLRIYNPRGCGAGTAANVPLGMRLRYDAPHNDRKHINGEWARITNPSSRKVRIGHWWFRDSALRRFRFPRRAVIRPHGSVLLRMGRGHNKRRIFHWGLHSPPLENPSYGRRWLGDGGYLFDRRGNIRASEIYP
jgi:endonuclease YncB( thermonuclease family)